MSPHHANVNSAVSTQLSCAVETAFRVPSSVLIVKQSIFVVHNRYAMVKGFLQPLPPTDGSPASNQLGNFFVFKKITHSIYLPCHVEYPMSLIVFYYLMFLFRSSSACRDPATFFSVSTTGN
jgi:hypothetical protein